MADRYIIELNQYISHYISTTTERYSFTAIINPYARLFSEMNEANRSGVARSARRKPEQTPLSRQFRTWFACEKLNSTSLRCVGPRVGTKRSLVNKENVCFLFLLFFTPFAYPFEESPPRGRESHSALLSVPRDKLVR